METDHQELPDDCAKQEPDVDNMDQIQQNLRYIAQLPPSLYNHVCMEHIIVVINTFIHFSETP